MFSYEKQDDRGRNECLRKSLCIYRNSMGGRSVDDSIYISLKQGFSATSKTNLATNTFYYKSSCDFLPKTTLYNVSFFFS